MSKFFLSINANAEPVYCVSKNGMSIYNPNVSECGRFAVDPSYYGLSSEEVKTLAHLNQSNNFNTEL
jgi:hypothetical protein